MNRSKAIGLKAATIGICGAGTMGGKAAGALVGDEMSVMAFDVQSSSVEALAKDGVQGAESPADLGAQCDVILLFLPGPRQIQAALTGKDGILSGIASAISPRTGSSGPGEASRRIIVDMSTVDPESTRRMHKIVADQGAAYLDAPVLGRPASVGKWVLPVGGPVEALDAARPVLEVLAATVVHAGPSGAGNQIKLLNQLMFGAINGITAEVMAIADRIGVSQELFYRTIGGSSAATVSPLFKELGRRVVEDDYSDPTFTVDLLIKDVSLGLEMATEGGAVPILTRSVDYINRLATQQGYGSDDTSVMWQAVKQTWTTGGKPDRQKR